MATGTDSERVTAPPDPRRLRAVLREIREELVGIDAAASRYAEATEPERATRWRELTEQTASEADGIDRRLTTVAGLLDDDPGLADLHSDAVIRIENGWQKLKAVCRPETGQPPDATAVRGCIDRCVLEIGYLTVPHRTNEILRSLRVGAALDFHREFAEEIPRRAARTAILSWLNSHPRQVSGVVDVPSGTVIKASGNPVRRISSWLLVLAVIVIALLSAGFAPALVELAGVGRAPEGASGPDYVWAVLFGYAGAVGHIAIAALKQLRRARTGPDQRFTAIGNFTIWVHINEMYLMLYAVAIPAVAYTVILSTGRIDYVTMAFVGFSIDSLLDVVLARFDKAVAGRTEAIARVLR